VAPRQGVSRVLAPLSISIVLSSKQEQNAEGQKRVRGCHRRNERPSRANHPTRQEKERGKTPQRWRTARSGQQGSISASLEGCRKWTCLGVTKCNKDESLDGVKSKEMFASFPSTLREPRSAGAKLPECQHVIRLVL